MKISQNSQRVSFVQEAAVAFAAIGLAVIARLLVEMIAPNLLPFVLTFPAVIFASLAAGPRSGTFVAIVCQLLVWFFVFPPHHSFKLTSAQAISLALSSVSLGLTVWIAAGHRAFTARLQDEAQRRVDLLSAALQEVDHRTKNNFQIAASLLLSQAAAQSDSACQLALREGASRLVSIAGVYADLALSSADISTVMLQDYLHELCVRFHETMLPPGVTLEFDGENVEAPPQLATTMGLIVNECLTNAAKHAFPKGEGALRMSLSREPGGLVVRVSDNGVGGAGPGRAGGGTGSALIATFAKSIKAKFETYDDHGRHCVLRVPV